MRKALAILLSAGAAAGIWAYFFSPMAEARRQFEQMVAKLNTTIATTQREPVVEFLQQHLAPQTRIKIEAHFESMGSTAGGTPFVMEYDKAGFISFATDLMGRFQTYGMEMKPGGFRYDWTLGEAAVSTKTSAWAEKQGGFGALGMPSRYGLEAPCNGNITFADDRAGGKRILIDKADCEFRVRILPKVDQESLDKIKERWREYQKP